MRSFKMLILRLESKNHHMTQRIFIILALILSINANASELNYSDTTHLKTYYADYISPVREIEPTYLDGVVYAGSWKDNWFMNLSGGASAFIGSPLGCNDIFGRLRPVMQISIGKWFTPSVGTRIMFQGLSFNSFENTTEKYRGYHADLMWNLIPAYNSEEHESHWGIIPYVGLGLIHNEDRKTNPFAFSYGLMGHYRLTKRLYLTMELGGMTTFKDFDGRGDSRKFGDNLFNLSAGLSFTIGKTGWRRVIDAQPYIKQNIWLSDYNVVLMDRESRLRLKYNASEETIAELKKILAIEGFLDKYRKLFADDSQQDFSELGLAPKNDYSGLNSLRARMKRNRTENLHNNKNSSLRNGDSTSEKRDNSGTITDNISSDSQCIGSPIHFFFKLGSADFTDPSQVLNIEEIARIANKYDLLIHIEGSADSATGNARINDSLSSVRTDYISKLFLQNGIKETQIRTNSIGGISDYSPIEANRQVRIMLFNKDD